MESPNEFINPHIHSNIKPLEHEDPNNYNVVLQMLQVLKATHDIVDTDIVSKHLPSMEHWKIFYYGYARAQGFNVRIESVAHNKFNEESHRLWVCSHEGFRRKKWVEMTERRKEPKPITRVGCKACLKVSLVRQTGEWVAKKFIHIHNHELASPSEIQFLTSNRSVPDSVTEQASAMRRAGIRTMNIMDYMAHQFGGRNNMPFLKKDLYNKLGSDRRSISHETDCEGALGYLTYAAQRDNNFYCRFNVDEDNKLHTIFWADGTSRRDYSIFGDVLAFDTTYRTNAYNKPLLVLVGVNHHYRTVVFGVALLADETTTTFDWVLQQFLDCMTNKHPDVVLTDGDLAIRASIQNNMPGSIHHLCAWHLETNAGTNIPNGEFKLQFSKLLYHYYTETEFEELWDQVIEQHSLQNNVWAVSMYERRRNWAETFLRGNFFGGMRTTQRCESMNSYMRRFLHSKQLLRDFVSQIDECIQCIRHTEMQDDFTTKHTQPVIPQNDPLNNIYQQAASTFTRAIYALVEKQIIHSHSYTVCATEYRMQTRTYRLSKYRKGEIRHTVTFVHDQEMLQCGCLLFETDGIPCKHIFSVIKHLSIDQIPPSLIKPRWRRDIKIMFPYQTPMEYTTCQTTIQSNRMSTLCAEFHSLGFLASQYDDTFNQARMDIKDLTMKFENVVHIRKGQSSGSNKNDDHNIPHEINIIRDPVVAKTKGREKEKGKGKENVEDPAVKRRKRCRICNEYGHNRQTCSQKLDDPTNNDYAYSPTISPMSLNNAGLNHSWTNPSMDNLNVQFSSSQYYNPTQNNNTFSNPESISCYYAS